MGKIDLESNVNILIVSFESSSDKSKKLITTDIESELININATGLLKRFMVLLKLAKRVPIKIPLRMGREGINQAMFEGKGINANLCILCYYILMILFS